MVEAAVEAVLEGISSDGFLAFIDRWVTQHAAPIGGIQWCDHGEGRSDVLAELAPPAMAAFHDYRAVYDSRIGSTLARAGISQEDFAQALVAKAAGDDVSSTLLELLEHLGDFGCFARMMAARQFAAAHEDE